jgi:C1A family cysteine protease
LSVTENFNQSNNSSETKNIRLPISILPSYYDLRLLGKLTPVGDQGSSGVCWAFASLGSLESCLLPNETWNFSENNMKNVLSSSYPQGFDREADDAGSWEEATAYLTRYSGPVTSAQDPFNDYSSYSPSGLTVVKHVQDTVLIDPRNSTGTIDNSQIKNAIMEYGAVYSLMSYDDFYFNPITDGYYYNGSLAVNHAVDIVGWDDNYSKDNFINGAPGNGAFIVRNSWGSDWGDNGYFYVSYYDKYLANSDYNVVFMDAEPTSNYDNIYQYDPYGAVGSLGYDNDVGWFSNIFKSNGNEKLEASSFYVFSPNSSYNIYVYLNPKGNSPVDGVLVDSQSGIISSEGYKTIQLDKIVQLLKGQ